MRQAAALAWSSSSPSSSSSTALSMMLFTIEGRCGSARVGTLNLGSVQVLTPNVLVSMRKGSPAGLAPGLYRSDVVSLDGVSPVLEDAPLSSSPSSPLRAGGKALGGTLRAPVLTTAEALMDDLASNGVHTRLAHDGGVHGFYRLRGNGVALAPRDPARFNAVIPATNAGIQLDTAGGRRSLTPAMYQQLVESLRPDLCFALSEELASPEAGRKSRCRTAVRRTLEWARESLGSATATPTPTLAVVSGGWDLESRIVCVSQLVEHHLRSPALAGFSVGGLGLGESEAERDVIMREVLARVPEEREDGKGALVRHVGGMGTPEAVLHGVRRGIDLFDSSYAAQATLQGAALVFPVTEAEEEVAEDADFGDGEKVMLRSPSLKRDVRPILPGCACSTCSRPHTRAYLHHLLETHEITGTTLLSAHNMHHFARFMDAVRGAVKGGEFERYADWFIGRRSRHDR